ncbi:MAG: response regulator, partial [Spirochaetales bacterium]|nr:response regulator [Spirochaetales bacterium]
DMVNLFDLEKLNKKQKFYDHNQLINFSNILKIKIIMFKEVASNKKIKIEKKIEENIYIRIDPFALDRIINNLIDNAIRYSNTNGYIEIILREIADKVEFIIKDTGIGIQKENLKNIFEPYYQLTHEKKNLQGIGIGLSIIKKILDDIDAEVEVKSEYNEGSEFIIHFEKLPKKSMLFNSSEILPCSNPIDFLYNFELKKEELCIGKPILLIVEDNINLLAYLQNSLLDKYNIYYSLNGKEAIKKLNYMPKPDLIISDIMMDEMDGFDFFKHISGNDEYKSIPFIFITARYNLKDKIHGLQSGAIDFIFKPFSIHELDAKIQSIIRMQTTQKENNFKEMEKKLAGIIRDDIIKDRFNSSNFDIRCKNNRITPREKDIITLLMKGYEYKEIAYTLNISINTLKPTINKIYKKLKVTNKVELVNFFLS